MIRACDDVLFRLVGDDAVLLKLDTGTYFGLDAVGARAWELLLEHGALEPVVEACLLEFEVDRETLRADLAALVDALAAKGLIVVTPRV